MERKIYLTLLIVTTFTLIIASGCGGGSDDIITPPSLQNTDNSSQNSGGYITVKIIWPQEEVEGKCIMSSGNEENSITASMPVWTNSVKIKVFEDPAPDDPNSYLLDPNTLTLLENGDPNAIGRVPNEPSVTAEIGPLPVLPAIVTAEAYTMSTKISYVAEKIQIKFGTNSVNLDLGEEYMNVKAQSAKMIINDENSITASLGTIFSTPTSKDAEPIPIEGQEITFSIDPTSTGTGEFEGGLAEITKTTDENGECEVKFISRTVGDVKINGEFIPDPNVPETSYIESCDITIINGSYNYFFQVTGITHELIVIPDFASPSLKLPEKKLHIYVKRELVGTYNYESVGPGKAVNLSIIDGDGEVEQPLLYTDENGKVLATITTDSSNPPPRTIVLRAECIPDYSSSSPISADIDIDVVDSIIFKGDFEGFTPGTTSANANGLWVGACDYPEENIIEDFGANGTSRCRCLYVPLDDNYHRASQAIPGKIYVWSLEQGYHWENLNLEGKAFEVRCYIKVGDEVLEDLTPETPRFRGAFRLPYHLQTFGLGFENNGPLVLNDNGVHSSAGDYGGDWMLFKVQVLPFQSSPAIHYCVNGTWGTIPVADADLILHYPAPFIESYGGSVWVDEMEIYDLEGFPEK